MAFTFKSSISGGSSDTTSLTTGAIGTVGADLIVVSVASYVVNGEPILSDSQSNTYTALTAYSTATLPRIKLYYCVNPATDASHTFSLAQNGAGANFCAISVIALIGSKTTSPFDQQNGNTAAASSTVTSGSITPTEDNEILITAAATQADTTGDPATGFTLGSHVGFSGGVHWSSMIAYKIQTTAAASDSTWTLASSSSSAASIASFKSAVAAGGKPWYPYHMTGNS